MEVAEEPMEVKEETVKRRVCNGKRWGVRKRIAGPAEWARIFFY